MLKYLLLALLFAAATLPTLAQAASVANPPASNYRYCNLIGNGAFGENSRLDYGQYAKPAVTSLESDAVYIPAAKKVADTNTNIELEALNVVVKKMDSAVQSLNYLSSHGWECMGATSLYSGVVIYVMRRRVQ